jgi:hypothetical protein
VKPNLISALSELQQHKHVVSAQHLQQTTSEHFGQCVKIHDLKAKRKPGTAGSWL